MGADKGGYGLSGRDDAGLVEAPALSYGVASLKWRPKLGLIGAGGISEYHLRAYRELGLEVAAIVNPTVAKAEARRDEFFPGAAVYGEAGRVWGRRDIEVVDIACHPEERVGLIEGALRAGKHVLSQKPFVEDLGEGERLCGLAEELGLVLAVNQNGRWAPHYRYALEAVRAGVLGELGSVDMMQQWDHSWTEGTAFEDLRHLVLYDFGIHWFDLARAFAEAAGKRLGRVYAGVGRLGYQRARAPFLAHAVMEGEGIQVRIGFNAGTRYGQRDQLVVAGELGTVRSGGGGLNVHQLRLWTAAGEARPELEGEWFRQGFQGTMVELLNAVVEGRVPENGARANLDSLRLCRAAMDSADSGRVVEL
jgi:predicted dehydrogenase